MEKNFFKAHRNLDEVYPSCNHVDCVNFDCPLSKGPCLFCVENSY